MATDDANDPRVIPGDDTQSNTNIFALGGLPFTCAKAGGLSTLTAIESCESEVPNGYAGFVPGLGVVYPPGIRNMVLYESGSAVTFTYWALAPLLNQTWTADGNHMLLSGAINYYIPAVGTYEVSGYITNLWYTDA